MLANIRFIAEKIFETIYCLIGL